MLNDINEIFDSDSDEEILFRIERLRNPKRFRERLNYVEELNDWEFSRRFRLNKPTFQLLLDRIEADIKPATNRNHAIQPITKLLLALRFYATGSMLLVVADFTGVSESAACVIIREVTEAIARLRRHYIYMPRTENEMLQVQLNFYRIARFPKVCGAIDCTHIEIESPGGNDAEYDRNRKGWSSWNVQTICDSNLRILDIIVRWPGSTHDQTIFNNSTVKRKFESGRMGDSLILGDSGYAITPYLMTPLVNPNLPEEMLYNESQIRTRNVVERSYGVWKRRFPVLSSCMRVSLERSQAIIIATAVLHNLAIEQKNEMPPEEPEIVAAIRANEELRRRQDRQQAQPQEPQRNQGNNVRRLSLVNEYFKNLVN